VGLALIFVIIVFGAFVALGVAATAFGPSLLRSSLISQVKNSCPRCELRIESVQLALITGHLVAEGVEFKDDPHKNVTVDFSIDHLDASFKPLSFLPFLHEAPVLLNSLARGAKVKVRELQSDGESPPAASSSRGASEPDYPPSGAVLVDLPKARVGGVNVDHGAFTYEAVKDGRVGRIELSDVRARVGSFATREALATGEYGHPLQMGALARLEHSGHVSLRVRFDPFATKNRDDIEVDVRGQEMAALGSFFIAESGVKVSGLLEQLHASLQLSQGDLTGKLSASYKGFHFEIMPNSDHGQVKTAVMQMLISTKFSSDQPKVGKKPANPSAPLPPEVSVSAQREPKMPVMKWILKGLKPAAEKILSS
jgi:hypothetical protein